MTRLSFLKPTTPTTRDLIESRPSPNMSVAPEFGGGTTTSPTPTQPTTSKTNNDSQKKSGSRRSSSTSPRSTSSATTPSSSSANLSVAPEFGGGQASVQQVTVIEDTQKGLSSSPFSALQNAGRNTINQRFEQIRPELKTTRTDLGPEFQTIQERSLPTLTQSPTPTNVEQLRRDIDRSTTQRQIIEAQLRNPDLTVSERVSLSGRQSFLFASEVTKGFTSPVVGFFEDPKGTTVNTLIGAGQLGLGLVTKPVQTTRGVLNVIGEKASTPSGIGELGFDVATGKFVGSTISRRATLLNDISREVVNTAKVLDLTRLNKKAAVFRGGKRLSPQSKIQTRKQNLNQAFDPRITRDVQTGESLKRLTPSQALRDPNVRKNLEVVSGLESGRFREVVVRTSPESLRRVNLERPSKDVFANLGGVKVGVPGKSIPAFQKVKGDVNVVGKRVRDSFTQPAINIPRRKQFRDPQGGSQALSDIRQNFRNIDSTSISSGQSSKVLLLQNTKNKLITNIKITSPQKRQPITSPQNQISDPRILLQDPIKKLDKPQNIKLDNPTLKTNVKSTDGRTKVREQILERLRLQKERLDLERKLKQQKEQTPIKIKDQFKSLDNILNKDKNKGKRKPEEPPKFETPRESIVNALDDAVTTKKKPELAFRNIESMSLSNKLGITNLGISATQSLNKVLPQTNFLSLSDSQTKSLSRMDSITDSQSKLSNDVNSLLVPVLSQSDKNINDVSLTSLTSQSFIEDNKVGRDNVVVQDISPVIDPPRPPPPRIIPPPRPPPPKPVPDNNVNIFRNINPKKIPKIKKVIKPEPLITFKLRNDPETKTGLTNVVPDTYTVEVKKRGSFIPIGTYQSAQTALREGAEEVRNTSSATYRITGENIQSNAKRYVSNTDDLRFSKKKGVNTNNQVKIVEKRNKRINTPGELREITNLGINTPRNKNNGSGFGNILNANTKTFNNVLGKVKNGKSLRSLRRGGFF